MDFALPRDGRHKWWSEPPAEFPHSWNGECQRLSHFLSRHIAASKHKLTDRIFPQRSSFKKVVAQLLVRCKQDPAIPSHERQPRLVGHAASEMSKVLLAAHTNRFQCFKDCGGIA